MEADAPCVLLVHCVDTEGPLTEPLEATFERLNTKFNLSLSPSEKLLRQLQEQQLEFGGREAEVADFVGPGRLAYLKTWEEVEAMVKEVSSEQFRFSHSDPCGNPYTFSWFVIDIVGYVDNPRRKAVGYHAVWDKYQALLSSNLYNDCFGWHFHTVPIGGHALDYNACWTNNDFHERSIARRLIERSWFPALYRAGGVIQRNDSSYWLEQFIPFDFSNRRQADERSGTAGGQTDWRGAPLSWRPYHPDFYDYRKPGKMKRAIFRTLDVETPAASLPESEISRAFEEALEYGSAVLSYTNHDRRDLRPDITLFFERFHAVAGRYPQVNWRHASALDAARIALKRQKHPELEFSVELHDSTLRIEASTEIFGPYPFVAIEEVGKVFYRTNVTMETDGTWAHSLARPDKVVRIGVGGSTACGQTAAKVVEVAL